MKILLLICLLMAVNCSKIVIENKMARAITSINGYLPNAGIDYAPSQIPSGETDVVIVDNDELYTANSTSGMIFLNYAGSTTHIGIGWNVVNTFVTPEGSSKLALWSGTSTDYAGTFNSLFSSTSPSSNSVWEYAQNGWLILRPDSQIKISGFMSSDMEGNIQIVLEEYLRSAVGQFYIATPTQPPLYLKYWDGNVEYDYFSNGFPANYMWNLVSTNGNLANAFVTISPPLSGADTWTGNTQCLASNTVSCPLTLTTLSDPTHNGALWFEVKLIENNQYSLRSYNAEAFLDWGNCPDAGTAVQSCLAGRKAGMTTTYLTTPNVPQLNFILIPVPLELQQSPPSLSSW